MKKAQRQELRERLMFVMHDMSNSVRLLDFAHNSTATKEVRSRYMHSVEDSLRHAMNELSAAAQLVIDQEG